MHNFPYKLTDALFIEWQYCNALLLEVTFPNTVYTDMHAFDILNY